MTNSAPQSVLSVITCMPLYFICYFEVMTAASKYVIEIPVNSIFKDRSRSAWNHEWSFSCLSLNFYFFYGYGKKKNYLLVIINLHGGKWSTVQKSREKSFISFISTKAKAKKGYGSWQWGDVHFKHRMSMNDT